jgi:hypothetical protein
MSTDMLAPMSLEEPVKHDIYNPTYHQYFFYRKCASDMSLQQPIFGLIVKFNNHQVVRQYSHHSHVSFLVRSACQILLQ